MTKSSNKNTALLTCVSFFSLLILLLSFSALRDSNISQAMFTVTLVLSVTFGLVSIAGFVETLIKPALGFQSFRWVFFAALAFVGYLSRVDAVNDINAVFHIDAGALPLTTIAGTVLRFADYMFWPMVIVFAGSIVVIAFMSWGSVLNDKDQVEKIGLGIRVSAAVISSGFACLLMIGHLNDAGIKSKLYRVAHKTDFVGSFNCEGIDPANFDALFIGPEQRRALLAPKISNKTDFLYEREAQPELMQPVEIPTYFSIIDCTPSSPPSVR